MFIRSEDAVPGGVTEPGVLVGAAETGLHVEHLPRQLGRVQLAAVGHEAVVPGPGRALLLPRPEVLGGVHAGGVLDPLDDLGHGHEVHLLVVLQGLVHPVEEGIQELGVVLQPD